MPPGAAPENQSEFTLYTRMTRFGLNLGGGEVEAIGSPKLTGRIEVDFYGGPDWVTEYVGFDNGTSDRVNLYTIYNF